MKTNKVSDNKNRVKKVLKKTGLNFIHSLPILVSILALVALLMTLISPKIYSSLFSGNTLIDPFLGAALGSILSGNPITSYIIGGEMQSSGISSVAIIAFMISWVTVGVVQAPAEAIIFTKRFTFIRNIIAFFSAIVIAIITAGILSW